MWVIFRHGEKQLQGFDPELTPRGLEQARSIVKNVQSGRIPKPNVLYVSTKKRTFQTLEPLGIATKLKPQIRAELTERVPGESTEKFRLRIQEFLVRLILYHQDHEVIYLCTHYDWIEEFLSTIECDTDLLRYSNFGAAQYILFDKKELWHFIRSELIQSDLIQGEDV